MKSAPNRIIIANFTKLFFFKNPQFFLIILKDFFQNLFNTETL